MTIYISKEYIQGTKSKKACGNHAIVRFERVNNDLYGNPLYRVYPVNYSFRSVKGIYRNYTSKGYYLLQSYSIEESLAELLKQADEFVSVSLDKSLLTDYREIHA